jgi:hypothetical protein
MKKSLCGRIMQHGWCLSNTLMGPTTYSSNANAKPTTPIPKKSTGLSISYAQRHLWFQQNAHGTAGHKVTPDRRKDAMYGRICIDFCLHKRNPIKQDSP